MLGSCKKCLAWFWFGFSEVLNVLLLTLGFEQRKKEKRKRRKRKRNEHNRKNREAREKERRESKKRNPN